MAKLNENEIFPDFKQQINQDGSDRAFKCLSRCKGKHEKKN